MGRQVLLADTAWVRLEEGESTSNPQVERKAAACLAAWLEITVAKRPHPLLLCTDWLLNHPNVDIVQQHLLLPLLAAGRAAQEQAAAAAGDAPVALKGGTDGGSEDGGRKGKAKAGKGSKATAAATTKLLLQPPLLRVQIATLAPCVSNYTLFFLREMAFNLSEGQTYSGGWVRGCGVPAMCVLQTICSKVGHACVAGGLLLPPTHVLPPAACAVSCTTCSAFSRGTACRFLPPAALFL